MITLSFCAKPFQIAGGDVGFHNALNRMFLFHQEQQRLRKDLEDEKKSRKRLENLLRKSLLRSTIEQTPISIEESSVIVS